MAALPGLQLNKVHNHLREQLVPLTSREIRAATGVDLDADAELRASLLGDTSKVRREADGRWRWKSRHYLTGFNDLLHFFSTAQEGVPEGVLLDSYRGVRGDIARLKDGGCVYALKAGSRTILYRRDARLELSVRPDVRDAYGAVPLPDPIEVHRHLVRRGLKETDDVRGAGVAGGMGGGAGAKRKRPGAGKKRGGGGARRVKLTNTHVAGIDGVDLTKDFQHGNGGAFGDR